MKVKYTLDSGEAESLRKAINDIPADLCRFVTCPDGEGDICENCPMCRINGTWSQALDTMHETIMPMIKKLEE